jgi:hypothetical protein
MQGPDAVSCWDQNCRDFFISSVPRGFNLGFQLRRLALQYLQFETCKMGAILSRLAPSCKRPGKQQVKQSLGLEVVGSGVGRSKRPRLANLST